MFTKLIVLLLVSPLFALAQNNCSDDPTFSWNTYRGDMVFTHRCAFLTNSNDPAVNQRRQRNHCDRAKWNGVLVKDRYRKACNNCGDTANCTDSPTWWRDSEGRRCSFYSKNPQACDAFTNPYGTNNILRSDACCACGGGIPSDGRGGHCRDIQGFRDSKGHGCAWYRDGYDQERCDMAWQYRNGNGRSAKQACCFCKNGENIDFLHSYPDADSEMTAEEE